MVRSFNSSAGVKPVAMQLLEALGSSLDLRVVLKAAYPLLTRLVPADYGALGVSASGEPSLRPIPKWQRTTSCAGR
jgi:hypothetical protein